MTSVNALFDDLLLNFFNVDQFLSLLPQQMILSYESFLLYFNHPQQNIYQMKNGIFGKIRLPDFYMDQSYTNVNHGSYGACPKVVMNQKYTIEKEMEFNCEKFLRFDVEEKIKETRTIVADHIKCSADNVFMVQNATDAINSLAKSLKWEKGDVIALPNTAYSCVKQTVSYLVERYQIEVLTINFTEQDFADPNTLQLKVEDSINMYPKKIKLAILDHIISVPAIVCPVESLVHFFRQKNILLFIDGAHAVCQLDLHINQMQPDAYFSNFHKWGYSPKNAAFLYLSDKMLEEIHPALTGNFKGQGVARQFFWTGTRDYSSYLAVPRGLQYFNSFGQNAVQYYCSYLSYEAGKKMAEIWKTKLLTDDRRMICNMCNIYVPSDSLEECVKIASQMLEKHNCFPVFFTFNGKVLCRISAQIYNQLIDFQNCARWFLELQKSQK